jgi:hypothetical protein
MLRPELRVLANSDSEMQSFESCRLRQPVRLQRIRKSGRAPPSKSPLTHMPDPAPLWRGFFLTCVGASGGFELAARSDHATSKICSS